MKFNKRIGQNRILKIDFSISYNVDLEEVSGVVKNILHSIF